ncbi:MAG: sigma-70 family RNA polymerase sigma factor [Chloroflexota bacterium]|nr:sigma-70 family RNA polymerase sigma factor [Chloroflexota bacterium]
MSGPGNADAADGEHSSGPSDEALLERLAAGADEGALSDLYDRYQAQMYGLAMRITRDPALAQDAVQEAFVGVWRNAARYAVGRSSVRTWMLSIAHHRAIDIVRRRRPADTLPEFETADPALTTPDVWPEVAQILDRAAVTAAMVGLPRAQRDAIQLAYFEGLTQVEIADRTGAPLGTVKSRVRLGLLQMRRALETGEAPS